MKSPVLFLLLLCLTTCLPGHASIYSTGNDLWLFAQAALENRLLSESSWQAIFTDYGNQVGYGWFVRPHLDRERVQMNGRFPGNETSRHLPLP